ncbi:MAG: hypothetical protein HOV81_05780 [Kofleriaceae bacterium]|nr:hypothetical protein [Kofleriaceae bacterium]
MFLRFIGLSFLSPGVVDPALPAAFAAPAGFGDLATGVLAIVATIGLARHTSWAIGSVWLFNIVGAADLVLAFIQGARSGLEPGMLGAGFYIVTSVVPLLLVSHALVFRVLAHR